MSVNITIKVSGINELIRDYEKFRFDMKENMIVPIDESAMKYLKVISANFQSQGRTFGEPWPPLSQATINIKRALSKQGKSIAITTPLIRTGKMRSGFGRQTKGKNKADIYNTQAYSIVHQEGQTVSWKGRSVKIPRRVLAEVDDERINMVANVFTKWFDAIVSKNKL